MSYKKSKPRSVAGTINDPTIKFADLTIDDQHFKLGYSFNSIALAEAETGTNLLSGLQSLTDLNAIQLRGLLYAALMIAHPDMTPDDAGALIRLDTLADCTMALASAYQLSLPEKKSVVVDPVEEPVIASQ